MRCELRDSRTLVIIPESVAEQEMLLRFQGRQAKAETPPPFQPNVTLLVLEQTEENGGSRP
jgi:hypothetical protein